MAQPAQRNIRITMAIKRKEANYPARLDQMGFKFDSVDNQLETYQTKMGSQDKMGFCPFFLKYPAKYPMSETNQGNAPILKLDFLKIEFQM